MTLQFDLGNEIYWMMGAKAGKVMQMPLTSHFFYSSLPDEQVEDVEKAQLLILALGTVHAICNPLSSWQSIKAAFASLGNRQGHRHKSRIPDLISSVIRRTCDPSIADTVNNHVMARSEQVKQGIRSQPKSLPKSYAWFGNQELAAFTNSTCGWVDLLDTRETSLVLTSQGWQAELTAMWPGRRLGIVPSTRRFVISTPWSIYRAWSGIRETYMS
ncbi:hypothetical protein PG988_012647 [Apiospora saccharicola]